MRNSHRRNSHPSPGTGSVGNLTVKSGGHAVFGEGSVLYGTNRIAGTLTVQGNVSGSKLELQDAAPVMIFDFSERSAEADSMVNDISLISNLSYHIVFDEEQSNGEYNLTDNGGADFNEALRVYGNDGVFYGTLTRNGMVLMDDRIVTLKSASGTLNLHLKRFLKTRTKVY